MVRVSSSLPLRDGQRRRAWPPRSHTSGLNILGRLGYFSLDLSLNAMQLLGLDQRVPRGYDGTC